MESMSITQILPIAQIVTSVLLVGAILLQQKGGGLGSAFGGLGTSYHTKRGFEKVLFILTIVLATLFVASTVASLIIGR